MSAYSDLILAKASLSAYWRMGESSGTVLTDAGPNSLNGTLAASGITYSVTGALANDADTALTFDASTDPASVADNNALDLTDGPLWIAFWFKRSATQGAIQRFLVKGGTASAYEVRFGGTNRIALLKGGVAGAIMSSSVVTDQNWHFFVLTKNGSTTNFYLDGQLDNAQVGTNQTLADNAGALTIGGTTTTRFPGSMDEVAIGKGAVLTADEVLQLYRTGVGAMVLSDTIGSSDASVSGPETVQADSVTLTESRTSDAASVLDDSLTVVDEQESLPESTLDDTVTLTDAHVAEGEIVLGDTVTLIDDLTSELIVVVQEPTGGRLRIRQPKRLPLPKQLKTTLSDVIYLTDDIAQDFTPSYTDELVILAAAVA